jgi:hypothetical protein
VIFAVIVFNAIVLGLETYSRVDEEIGPARRAPRARPGQPVAARAAQRRLLSGVQTLRDTIDNLEDRLGGDGAGPQSKTTLQR